MDAHSVVVPRLVTDRLRLREFRIEDFDGYAASAADPIGTKFLSGVTERRQAWRIFSAGAGAWVLSGKGWWMIELTETKQVIGTVGAFVREGWIPDVELGWTLYRPFWKKGYALEAATAARDHALNQWKAPRIIAHIARGNVPSIAVAERLGMKDEGDVDYYGESCGRWASGRLTHTTPAPEDPSA